MTTVGTNPPWVFLDCPLENVKGFEEANSEIISKVQEGKMILSQALSDASYQEDQTRFVKELKWRFYFVYWSALYAAKSTNSDKKNLVECGVCDGLTASYAMSALKKLEKDFSCYLYDAWDAMKAELLLESEMANANNYAYLQLDNTIRNLKDFSKNVVFNKGYIPESFAQSKNPSDLVWLHIDLNSSLATQACLDFFFEKILPGGIILLDDYGWQGFEDTKKAVDCFFQMKNAELLHLPTAQAIVFKRY